MAFPLPSHLPRAAYSQDGTSFGSSSSHATPFLEKVARVAFKDINHATSSGWVKDLDKAILSTKERIHARIHSDLPLFEQQLESSRQVQSRLKSLSTSVEDLDESLNDAETGILPTLLRNLTAHSELAQRSSDADARSAAMFHLLQCRDAYRALSNLENDGLLADAVKQGDVLRGLLSDVPEYLSSASLILDLKRKFRVLVDRVQEKLGDAYGRCINIVSTSDLASLTVNQSVFVAASSSTISLPQLFQSLSPDVVANRMTSLRKDIISKLVEPLLSRPSRNTKTSPTNPSTTAIGFEVSFTSIEPTDPLNNLWELLTYLQNNLLPNLPPPYDVSFPASLYQPLAEAVLTQLLRPAIPPSLSLLPSFLKTVSIIVDMEAGLMAKMGISSPRGKLIDEWARDVATHFEKKRRENIVAAVRLLIEDPEGDESGVGIRVEEEFVGHAECENESSASSAIEAETTSSQTEDVDDGAGWDFDDQPAASPSAEVATDLTESETTTEISLDTEAEDGWGFDDDVEPPTSPAVPLAQGDSTTDTSELESGSEQGHQADASSGWDWEDDQPQSPESPRPNLGPARPARGLEKFSAGRHGSSEVSYSSSSAASTGAIVLAEELAVPTLSEPPKGGKQIGSSGSPPARRQKRTPESYLISPSAKKILDFAEQTLVEAKHLMLSNIFPPHIPPHGTLLFMSSPAIFDLFRALYPLSHSDSLTPSDATVAPYSSSDAMRFSNDCKFLAAQVAKLVKQADLDAVKLKLQETQERLVTTSETWFDATLDHAIENFDSLISRDQGFTECGDDTQFASYQNTFEQVLHNMNATARSWKNVLTPTAYYDAMGSLVDCTLAHIIEDITSLRDIPELESHRLNELLKILTPLEELFIENGRSAVVAYVPLWLKFSYLAELLEASIADISYLFEEGALIDFQVEELVRLVRALFADTPLRARTIEKISAGHPVSTPR